MGSNIPYAPVITKFENTSEFTYLADHFKKHKCYTKLPEGTEEYKNFWKEVRSKCIYGMINTKGIAITGQYFFYLNFIQILGRDSETNRKKKIFPRFLDIDYDYFWCLDYCRKHQKGLLLVKPRRLGFSYKAAAICTHEFTFYKDSKSIISAFMTKFADNTMGMILDNINFLRNYTEFGKQCNPDTRDFIKARFKVKIGGLEVWRGYNSEVKQITFKDNEFAAVGLSANWFIMDEAGVFPNIISSYNMSEPTIKDGSEYTGVALVFGSAGSMEAGSQYFYEMFMNPANYNMLEFPNSEEGAKSTGWFVRATRGRLGKSKLTGEEMVDRDGNSNEEEAEKDILFEREQKKRTGDSRTLKDHVTQYPLSYKDAFLRNTGNIFPVTEIQEHLANIESHKDLNEAGKKIELYFDSENKLQSRLSPDKYEIIDFPIKSTEKTEGCIVIYEEPEKSPDGTIPHSLYLASCDPYDQDRAANTTSLGSFFVYKRFTTANKTHDIIVAEYTGRPEIADEFYEICRKLCIYYNAKCLYENQLKGFKVYFEQKKSLHFLYETPAILKDIVKDTNVTRGYGIHMTKEIKRQCEIYLRQWLIETREIKEGTNGEKKIILNLHTILNKALLKELIAYDPYEGNFDRVIAFMLCILQKQELYKISVTEFKPKTLYDSDPFFGKTHFKKEGFLKNPYLTKDKEFKWA